MLRPYQLQAVAAVRAHWQAGRRRVLVALPTGAGKTCVAAALQPDLCVVHTRTLLHQTKARLPGVTVRTVQAIVRAGVPVVARVVFIDECHHIAAGKWSRLMALLPRDCRIVGCTATPERADGLGLADHFQALVANVTYSELRSAGWLAPCDVVDTRGMDPAAAYLQAGGRRPGILFAPTIADCDRAVATLLGCGLRAATITAYTPGCLRSARLEAFQAGQLDVLASPSALAEGFDSPRAAVCVLAVTCDHVGTYLQRVNRVTRPHPSKWSGAPALVLDCTGAAERHGHPLDDREYSLQGRGIRPAPVARKHGGMRTVRVAPVAPWLSAAAPASRVRRVAAPGALQVVAGLWRWFWAA